MDIADSFGEVVPDLSIAIEFPFAVAIDVEVFTANMPGCGLILETNGHGVCKPVVDVGIPQQLPADLNIHIAETGGVHDFADVVGSVLEDDVAIFVTV